MKLTISTVALVALAAVSAAAAGVSQDRIPDAQRPATMDALGDDNYRLCGARNRRRHLHPC